MKKILRNGMLAGLLAISANAAQDQIDLTGVINTTVVAGFVEVSGETGAGVFINNAANSVDFGAIDAGGTFAAVTKPIYVKTNNRSGATMTLTDSDNSGNLVESGGDTIQVVYTFGGSNITLGSSFDLTRSVNAGSKSVGDLVIKPSSTTANQTAGTYSTTLAVTIAAK